MCLSERTRVHTQTHMETALGRQRQRWKLLHRKARNTWELQVPNMWATKPPSLQPPANQVFPAEDPSIVGQTTSHCILNYCPTENVSIIERLFYASKYWVFCHTVIIHGAGISRVSDMVAWRQVPQSTPHKGLTSHLYSDSVLSTRGDPQQKRGTQLGVPWEGRHWGWNDRNDKPRKISHGLSHSILPTDQWSRSCYQGHFYKWEPWGTKRLRYWPWDTQFVPGKHRLHT